MSTRIEKNKYLISKSKKITTVPTEAPPSYVSGAPIPTQPNKDGTYKVFICHLCKARTLVVTDQHPSAKTGNLVINVLTDP